MNSQLFSFLQSLKSLYGNRLVLNTDGLPEYSRDASEIKVKPSAIIFPKNEREIISVIKSCHDSKIPTVLRGAGTGYTGGAVPIPGALLISIEKLKKLEIDAEKKVAFCGPGVITIDLMKEVEKYNLFYPPDPASYDESTLGGNIAECAGGLHCKKYGVTKDYVIGLRSITPKGEIIETGIYSDGDLFDLTAVQVGSEGLLTAVTEIAFRLINHEETGSTILATFHSAENAAQVVTEITECGIVPSVLEFMDGDAIECSNRYERSIDIDKAEAVLLAETSGINRVTEAAEIIKICNKNNASLLQEEKDYKKADRLWKIRRNLSKAVKDSAKHKISEDVCVPPSKLPELVRFVSRLNNELPMRINSYGHAGDGNLHVNFLTDDDKYIESGLLGKGIDRLFKKTLELGGTLTGEHGIGLTKKDYIHLEFDSPTLKAMKNVKFAFDPENLFNPGKMFACVDK